VEKIKKKR